MPSFRFYHPIEVRYGDLDPQGHVNNAKYLTYMEQARIAYLRHLSLWEGGSFLKLGIILADIQVTFLAPILFGQDVRVGVRVTRLGNKSMTMEHEIVDRLNGRPQATGTSVLVAYNYETENSIFIPDGWRRTITAFEQLEPSP